MCRGQGLRHGGSGQAPLVDGLRVALNFREAGVAGDGGNLVRGTPYFSEPPRRGLAEPVKDAMVRQPGGRTPLAELLAESVTLKGPAVLCRLELLSEIAPGLKRAAFMFNPDNATASVYVPSVEAAARSLKIVPIITPVHSDGEIETAIIALGREPQGGLVVMPDT